MLFQNPTSNSTGTWGRKGGSLLWSLSQSFLPAELQQQVFARNVTTEHEPQGTLSLSVRFGFRSLFSLPKFLAGDRKSVNYVPLLELSESLATKEGLFWVERAFRKQTIWRVKSCSCEEILIAPTWQPWIGWMASQGVCNRKNMILVTTVFGAIKALQGKILFLAGIYTL